MAKAKETKSVITAENRHEFGGDVRLKRSSVDKYGNQRAYRAPHRRADSILNLYPGDVINIENPSVDVQMGWCEQSSNPNAAAHVLAMVRSGWKFCAADEWDLSPELSVAMTTNEEGKIVTNTGTVHRLALMYREAALMDEQDRENREYSADVQQQQQDKIAQTIDELAHNTGAMGWVDEEGERKVRSALGR